MYRQYENPRELQTALEHLQAEFADITASGKVDDDTFYYYFDRISELEDRINFAWQDEEFDLQEVY